MGRIKSKLVKRTSNLLLREENSFTEKFEDNKGLLKTLDTSKKIKNQVAGFISRVKKKEIDKLEKLK